ncbi:GNAT family N-acetyltransferase [Amycolatopsis sp. NPDC102389]|uniref:GNAT family N-acetyltransferase n=1 Tax=Amycolatopsis sp. NPDC102389 TaxID=3363941 RepID=UPI0037F79637
MWPSGVGFRGMRVDQGWCPAHPAGARAPVRRRFGVECCALLFGGLKSVSRKSCSLRPPSDDDYGLMEQWLRPMSLASALTGDMNETVTARELKVANDGGAVRYLLVVAENGDPVGVVNYRKAGSAGSYAIGGAIGDPGLWRRGIGAEALGILVDHLFHQCNAHRVEFTTASYNKHTMSILTKGGFVLEGVLRDYYFLDGQYHDRTVWSILRDEFVIGAKAFAKSSPVEDVIPAEDKQQARDAFAKFLANDPQTSLRDFADRAARERPY